jgi:AcrR family transcriptional regulator
MTAPAASRGRRDGRERELRGTARRRLLDAALGELSRHGYAGTSLEAIARRAGLTRGAIYWNFRSKDDLFRELLDERLDRPVRELMRITETAPGDTPTAKAISQGFARLVRERADVLTLLFEHWAVAVRGGAQRRRYNRRQAALRDVLARTLEARHAATGVPLTYPAERLATAVLALAHGLGMTALVEPGAVDDELLGEILDLLYDGLAARTGA